jgi:hypothetical protein
MTYFGFKTVHEPHEAGIGRIFPERVNLQIDFTERNRKMKLPII